MVGNEPAVVVDFQGMIDYAKSHEAHPWEGDWTC
jgi:hypothetical protein